MRRDAGSGRQRATCVGVPSAAAPYTGVAARLASHHLPFVVSDSVVLSAAVELRRPSAPATTLPMLGDAAPWLTRFVPPFTFGDFFAPEDTVLCALATRAALERAGREGDATGRVVELACGSALVLAEQLLVDSRLRGWGAEVDSGAVRRARANVALLGVRDRTRLRRLGLFHRRLPGWLAAVDADVVACNPPYIPEPPGTSLALVAGAGADGARHPRRVLRVAAAAEVRRLLLSWCSVGDPVGVARAAARRGYRLTALWATVIADGEYSGAVHAYLRTLPTAFLSEAPATLLALAPDGAARFAYLLLAGEFVRDPDASTRAARLAGVRRVRGLVRAFARGGVEALERAHAREASHGVPLRLFACDRWDELRLRARAHGCVRRAGCDAWTMPSMP